MSKRYNPAGTALIIAVVMVIVFFAQYIPLIGGFGFVESIQDIYTNTFTVAIVLFTMMEAVATTMQYNLEKERADRDEPDLRITNQVCEFRGYNLNYDFEIDNLGEKGTSIKNVKLVKIDDVDVDVDPDHMTYWVDGIPTTSYIMFINPRSTLGVNAAYFYQI